jgi:hypothetical protein
VAMISPSCLELEPACLVVERVICKWKHILNSFMKIEDSLTHLRSILVNQPSSM